MIEPLLVTMERAAFLLSLSRRMLDKMRVAGEIQTTKIGSKRLVPMREINRIAAAREGMEQNPAAQSVAGAVEGLKS